ncbi:FkbM family methyltransferase [Salinibacter ruber]|nr:FkbM family methyltransferase [Salinibacter ruber]
MDYIKDLILRSFKLTGYKISKIKDKSNYYKRWDILKENGLEVNTVIDIGVGYGTIELYKNATFEYLFLVEPLEVYKSEISNILKTFNGEWCKTALSDFQGNTEINYYAKYPEKTSVKDRVNKFERKGEKKNVSVEVNTLDGIIKNKSFGTPIGIKIDAEGNELNILKGSVSTLEYTKYVVVEAPIVERFSNGYSLEELIKFMNENDFYIKNVVDVDDGSIVKFIDFLFYNRKYD